MVIAFEFTKMRENKKAQKHTHTRGGWRGGEDYDGTEKKGNHHHQQQKRQRQKQKVETYSRAFS